MIRSIHRKYFAFAVVLIVCTAITGARSEKNWYELYFTSPGHEKTNQRNPEKGIIKTINEAQKSFYGAFYEITAKPVITALIKAKERGIDVMLVVDDGAMNASPREENVEAFNTLKESGIPVVDDGRRQLMHNKFAIIDESIVWTGSYNLTDNCGHKNNNNAIKIYSRELAAIYLEEFFEMFEGKVFGNRSDGKPFGKLTALSGEEKYHVVIEGTHINAYFSPENRIESIIIDHIKKAKVSIHFMAFVFTSNKMAEAMIKKAKEGVKVSGIIEKKGSLRKESRYPLFKSEASECKNLDVVLDKNKKIMHHKVIVIDKKLVITGSYNFTKNADRNNDENILVIAHTGIAEEFLNEFNKLR